MAAYRRFVIVVALLGTLSCGGSRLPTTPLLSGAPLATSYLNELVDLLEKYSYKRKSIDWTSFRAAVLQAGSGATSVATAAPGIQKAMMLLNDSHSRWIAAPPSTTVIGYSSKVCRASGAGVPAVPADIGYVKVTSFSGSGAAATAFADSIQAQIKTSDRDGLSGWIVDLRGNGGGNMWPMLAGLTSILDDGLVGHFVNPDGFTTPWEVHGNAIESGSFTAASTSVAYELKTPAPRVAVLVDNGVASSGEATFIAFMGRPNTRSFGGATCGLSTAVAQYLMNDSANMLLAVSLMADRNLVAFGDQLFPDEVLDDAVNATVTRAIAWLRGGK